jgi:dTMP kinase
MNRGYLISFEGQDGSGKTELLHRVNHALRKKGYETSIVEEFSDSPLGNYLKELLRKDKFLRLQKNIPTAFSGAMCVIADLYYQDEHEIKPKLNEGKIVLKERHIDTLFACEIPKIKDDYPDLDTESLYNWIESVSTQLYIPDLTFLLMVSEDILIERIRNRGESVSEEDLRVFAEREKIYRQLAEKYKDRIVVFDNKKEIEKAVEEFTEFILSFIQRTTT